MSQHVIPTRVYYTIFLALMVLTSLTVWAAFQDFGAFNNVVAMGIACTKATLVVLYFMHVRYSSKVTWLFVITGIIFLFILFTILMGDYLTRGWQVLPQSW